MGPNTLTIEVTGREKRDVVRALRAFADERENEGDAAEADRLRSLASRIQRE
jgi:hypothetical protein